MRDILLDLRHPQVYEKGKRPIVIASQLVQGISINLLAFYHKCRALIGYATHYLFNK